MVQPLRSFEDVGKKRTGIHAGGRQQKYFLDEPGRRLLLAKYDGTCATIDELARRIAVPRDTIKRWAGQLGLTRQKEPAWTPEEIEYLQTHLSHTRMSTMSKTLGRTITAIKLKAKRLGVNKCYQEGYTMRGLCLGLGCDHHAVERWMRQGWLKGKRRGTERTQQQGGDVWLFTDHAIREFIIAHPQEVDPRRADWLWLVDVLAGGRFGIGELKVERGEAQ